MPSKVKIMDVCYKRFLALTEKRNYKHIGYVVQSRDTGDVCLLNGTCIRKMSAEEFEELISTARGV